MTLAHTIRLSTLATAIVLAACSGSPGSQDSTPSTVVSNYAKGAGRNMIVIGSGFKYPQGVAVDGRGNVYVTDSGHSEVKKVAPDGTITVISNGHEARPRGVSCDTKGNFIFASFPKPGKILQYRKARTYSRGPVPQVAGIFYQPNGSVLAVSAEPHGALYSVSRGDKVMYKYDHLSEPVGVAADNSGYTYVADIGLHEVVRIKGSRAVPIGSGFDRPEGVALDATGDVYVIDYGTGTLYVVNPAGDTSTVATGFLHPQGVAVDQADDLFVADSGHNQIVELPSSSR